MGAAFVPSVTIVQCLANHMLSWTSALTLSC